MCFDLCFSDWFFDSIGTGNYHNDEYSQCFRLEPNILVFYNIRKCYVGRQLNTRPQSLQNYHICLSGVVSCPSSYIGFMHTSLCSINSWIEDMSRNVTCWQVWYRPSGVRRRGHNQGTWTSICFDTADCASWSPPRSSSWVESDNIQHQDFHLKWS